ncbi:MAG: regulatory protein RecX [Phycisphaerales bacterium]
MNDDRPGFELTSDATATIDEIERWKPTKRDPGRVSLVVNRRVVATLPREQASDLGATPGAAWTDELQAAVEQAVADDKARRSALRTLERRAQSRGEMVERLRRKGHEPAVSERVVDRLVAAGLINDEDYGRALIREITNAKPAGPRLLRQKLTMRRLDRRLIDRLIREWVDARAAEQPDGEIDPALERLIERKLASMTKLDEATRARRLYGFLARRGFEPDTVRDLTRRFVYESSDSDGA